jgi:ring-1,2-phenylacetyl-CoA epoxidase subunit PaaB
MMTSPRINPPKQTGDLSFPEVDSFPIWEVFTQKKPTKEHIHAGSLSAPDASLAQQFAREHYGQDQVCISLWVGTRSDFLAVDGKQDTYELFVQWESGDRHIHIGTVEASNGQDAKSKCESQFLDDKPFFSVWSISASDLTVIDEKDNLIWRTTDQTYRLASGYSRVVRKKWDAIREAEAVDAYQEEDLKDTF